MKKALIKILFSLIFLTFSSSSTFAQSTWTSECFYSDGASQVATFGGITCVMRNLLGIIVPLIGISILLMIVYGAYQILMSGGDPKGVEGGKNTITYAVLGLVVALSSLFLIRLVGFITGAQNLLEFNVFQEF